MSQLREVQRLKAENQQLRSEIQRLQVENQAAKDKEIACREERARRDQDRLNRLMYPRGACESSSSPVSGSESQTSKQISIPQEIIDQFIDHLYNDQEALKTCALVCRAWVSSSRYHLFGHVSIWVLEHVRFSDFIGHLDHPLCTFALSVRELTISTSTEDGRPLHLQADLGPDWADPLIPYLAKLTSVKTGRQQNWRMAIQWLGTTF
jgi:hypothetical protein